MNLKELLGKELLIFDGGMGTMLQDRGLAAGELPELWNITRRDVVLDIHRAYARAGCHILKTNTFGANRLKLADTGFTPGQIVAAGVSAAKEAAGETGAFIALDIGPTGRLLAPFGDLEFEAAVDIFAEMITAGAAAGAGCVLIETMNDTYEIKAAMLAAKECCDLPVMVTFTPDASGRLITGGDIPAAVCLIEGLGAAALGLNCGAGPEQMKALLPELLKYSSVPVIISPNAGIPELVNGKTAFHVTPAEFAAQMAAFAADVHIIGGCCGTTPAHIAAAVKTCRGITPVPVTQKAYTFVSSYGKTVEIGGGVIIGERINPTGKPRMKQALRDNDMEYLYKEALAQVGHSADILDVNAGLPEIDEAELLPRAVRGLQCVTDAPLQIDTADPAAAERALRCYNGKPLFNSVSGKRESLEKILPLVKKYGAAMVALTLDDDGIPATAGERVAVAEKIIAAAAAYGIPQKDILIDTLTLPVSTGADNARVTLDAMEQVRDRLGVHTVLGVSNISFGLPERERLNAAFYTLALRAGLSAGIINPLSAAITDALYTYRALSGADGNCGAYIRRFSGSAAPAREVSGSAEPATLYDAILTGMREQAGRAARDLLETMPPMAVINDHLIPALDKAGQDFENRALFLPQLLMSAEAAGQAFEVIKRQLAEQGEPREKRGRIVLATVKGDIHDIGKNIVKTLLENYNFQVIDLGKNVEPELVVETVLKERAGLVGLSALMTTTVVEMEKTVRLLKEKAPGCPVMVGGAVLTPEYARRIGADFYSKDAMGGVRFAERVFS
ncbi:MAG: homocysteine S-methyltransferase family protein [Oscillospiraceae bacterium]|nr:homocysteine S-methyltransferase family protein [Oscillospiraceae bacterium]